MPYKIIPITRGHSNQNQLWLANIWEYIGGYTVLGPIVGSDYYAPP